MITVKEKQAFSRVIFALFLILIVILRIMKMHNEYSPHIPYTVVITEVLLGFFVIFLFINTIRFINEAVDIFRKKKNG